MKKLSFKKGLLPRDGLDFRDNRILTQERVLEHFSPKEVVIPMLQHMGTPAVPLVKVGDSVVIGQMIAKPSSPMSAAVHASISGTVTSLDSIRLPNGIRCTAVHILNDLKRRTSDRVQNRAYPERLTPTELLKLLLYSGIVGMGGEGYPTSAKCIQAARSGVKTLLINGSACEPLLTCDAHQMREQSQRVVQGAVALAGICRATQIIFCIQDKWQQEIETMSNSIARFSNSYPDRSLSLRVLKSRFPQGYDKLLVKAIYDVELKASQNPEETLGVTVFNVSTCAAFWEQVEKNLPCTSRVITIAGDTLSARNLLVPIGTPVSELLAYVPGTSSCERIVLGGALTGVTLTNLYTPILKTTQGITLVRTGKWAPTNCIHCGNCVASCPVGLLPYLCEQLIAAGAREPAVKAMLLQEHLEDCIACGACSYVCPAGKELSNQIARTAHRLRMERSRQT